MKASIIIPCKEVDSLVEECVENCRRLDYDDFEIILLPDEDCNGISGVKIIPTGAVTPGAKRNLGVSHASGDILAFIDSDAYPARNWLNNASKYLADPSVAAVVTAGGVSAASAPGLPHTPTLDPAILTLCSMKSASLSRNIACVKSSTTPALFPPANG